MTALRQVGGRDAPSVGGTPLSDLEQYSLRIFVANFITGLRDPELRKEGVNQSALSAAGLRAAYQCVQRSQEILRVRERMARDTAA